MVPSLRFGWEPVILNTAMAYGVVRPSSGGPDKTELRTFRWEVPI